MSTNRHIDKLCAIAAAVALLISAVFLNGNIGVQARAMGYEDRLFDTTMVHTIDIVIDDWEAFLTTATSEEYSVCDVVIDGEAFRNVGIRGKGNTSLSTVSSMDSDRYSFKLEFDQYDPTRSYYGLDKLSLNNLIQDNTMMKDYLTYQMMNEFGVAAPLSSFAYITVNGEDWGLYLAVEAVEESFLQRNYGSDYGDLYKPDSMNMGGGRGNGKDFKMEDAMGDSGEESFGGEMPDRAEGFDRSQMGSRGQQGGQMPPDAGTSEQGGFDPSQMGGGFRGQQGGFDPSQMGDTPAGDRGGGMGSGETKLQYSDDDPDSYSTIFASSKTDVTGADQTRLIGALKALGEGDASAVDAEAVIRYFVVHNYVVNGDSYTGSMVHNYYLYEEEGRLSMIPWDYNLAFGTFQGNQASSAVNDDIDAPLSVTGSDRPMIDWIFGSEEYTELYHTLFREFLDTVDASSIITRARELIAPYVQKDPTKFCTYAEFETGVETLLAFCDLRSQSVAQQLAGEDGTVDASAITLSDMGTMNHGGTDRGQMPEMGGDSTQVPQMPGGQEPPGFDDQGSMELPEDMEMPEGMEMPGGMGNMFPGQSTDSRGSFPDRGQTGTGTVQGASQWVLLGLVAMILAAGLLFAFKYRR